MGPYKKLKRWSMCKGRDQTGCSLQVVHCLAHCLSGLDANWSRYLRLSSPRIPIMQKVLSSAFNKPTFCSMSYLLINCLDCYLLREWKKCSQKEARSLPVTFKIVLLYSGWGWMLPLPLRCAALNLVLCVSKLATQNKTCNPKHLDGMFRLNSRKLSSKYICNVTSSCLLYFLCIKQPLNVYCLDMIGSFFTSIKST